MIGTRPLTPNSAGITGPMNINAVIAHLVEMTPPQRKQFAQMHMDDPMMLSAAKYVDTQIAKQAQSLAAQATGAAPPPVNQQVVAQMSPQPPVRQAAPQPQAAPQDESQPMPEDSGIGQLPAQNMQGMAAGGIVAFNGEKGSLVNAFGVEIDPSTGNSVVPPYKRVLEAFSDWKERTDNPVRINQSGPHPRNKPAVAEAPAAPSPAARKDDRTKRDAANYAPVEAVPEKKTGIDQLRVPNVAPAPVVAPTIQASSAPAAASPDYSAMYANARQAQGNPRDNLPPEIAEIGDLAQAQRDKAMALADKQEQGLKTLVDERTARQNAREQNIAQQEAINPWMAMITGGLGIAQSKGKGLSGLAEGSQLGINQYMTEAKYTNAQRQKLEDARDALQDLKYSAETMTNKDRLAAENSLTQGLMAVKDATVKHIQHKEDVNERTAGHIFDAGVQQGIETQREAHQTQLEGQRQQFESGIHASDNAQRLAIARMEIGAANARANQLPGEARTLMALGGGDLKKGMEMQAAIAAGKFNPMNAYIQYYLPSVSKAQSLDPSVQAKSFDQFKAMLGMDVTRP